MAGIGDVNGDGFADVAVGDSNSDSFGSGGSASVYAGNSNVKGLLPTPLAVLPGRGPHGEFGWTLAGPGDVNGDGLSDLIVGAYNLPSGSSSSGAAYLYLGNLNRFPTSPTTTVPGPSTGTHFGQSLE